ncbi:MAG: N-acetyltransferase [Calditrichaeota bacterium]|nr:MAG: N-acetyltransferase [Calditrichota bacterium]MBL1206472.1 N-acetyltransferase [Calditrichota bacterium]NOG46299.1 GNAT family N-acetyltransferase [Calditrichota bacterium]
MGDLEVLNAISIESKMHWGYPKEWIEKWVDDLTLTENDFADQKIFKLEKDKAIIGWCSIQENETSYEVMNLWVKPDFIGSGYGKILLHESLKKVASKKKSIIVEADPNAEAFYASQGFVTYDKIESYPKDSFLPLMRKEQ